MTRVFKVYDDEWEATMSEQQLKEFAVEQVECSPDGFMEGSFYFLTGKDKEVVTELAKKIRDAEGCFKANSLTVEEAMLIIVESMHTVDELNIY